MTEDERLQLAEKVNAAKAIIDSALTEPDVHVVIVCMQDTTQIMSVHTLNATAEQATSMLRIAGLYTEAPAAEDLRRAH